MGGYRQDLLRSLNQLLRVFVQAMEVGPSVKVRSFGLEVDALPMVRGTLICTDMSETMQDFALCAQVLPTE